MTRLPYMQVWVGDLLSSTMHLSLEQRGGYIVLMLTMWNAGGSLPSDPTKLARICGVSLKRWQSIAPEILEFFDTTGDRITQKRLAAEHQKQLEIIEKKSAAGKLGNLAKSLKSNNTTSANATAKTNDRERNLESESESYSELKEEKNSQLAMPVVISEPMGKGRRRKKATPIDLPEDFVFSDRHWNFGSQIGLTADQIQASQTKLKRWVKSQGKRCADWDPFIESWLEREFEFLRQPGRGTPVRNDRDGFSDYANGVDHG